MLIEMKSPAFKKQGKERPAIQFKEGLNVVLGKEDGAMSIGKSSSLLAIDFVFGGDTYIKSDGVQKEGHHTIFFTFLFDGVKYFFARNTGDSNTIFICDENYELTGNQYTKEEFTTWLKKQYHMDFAGLSFRIALSSFFRVYGKKNTDELNPLQGIPGQNMDKSITSILTLFDKYKDIEEFKTNVTEHKKKLDAYKEARRYHFISDLVGGQKKYEENLAVIRDLELQLATLMEEAEKGHSEEEIELNKKKAALTTQKLNYEKAIHAKEMKLRLVNMSLDYGLYPTEADVKERFQQLKKQLTAVYGKGYVDDGGESYMIVNRLGSACIHYERAMMGSSYTIGFTIDDAKAYQMAYGEMADKENESLPRIIENGLATAECHTDIVGLGYKLLKNKSLSAAKTVLTEYEYVMGKLTAKQQSASLSINDYHSTIVLSRKKQSFTTLTIIANDDVEKVRKSLKTYGFMTTDNSHFQQGKMSATLNVDSQGQVVLQMK